jgi:SAM-dependent methyltransferase
MRARDWIRGAYQGVLNRQLAAALSADDPQWQLLQRFCPPDRDARILDAGCGYGRYAAALARLGYSEIDGVDLFERIPARGFRYCQADVARLPFQDRSFAFLYSLSVLYYLPDPAVAITELARVLMPGATLLMTVHTRYSLYTVARIVRRSLGLASARHLQGVSFHSPGTYLRILSKLGFSILLVDGFYLSSGLVRLLSRAGILRDCKGFDAPAARSRLAGWRDRLDAELAYHAVIAARKREMVE